MSLGFTSASSLKTVTISAALITTRMLLACLALGGAIYILILGTDWRFRYSDGHLIRQGVTIYAQQGPVDVAVMGTSRAMGAIIAPEFADLLGEELIVYDLSFSRGGSGAEYAVMRDLLEHREVSMLLVEYNEWEKEILTHPNFFRVSRYSDIIFDPGPRKNILSNWAVKCRLLQLKFSEIVSLRTKKGDRMLVERKLTPAVSFDRSKPYSIRANRVAPYYDRKTEPADKPYIKGWDFDADTERRQSIYLKRLIRLAKEKNVTIAFFHQPDIETPPIEPAFAQAFEVEFGAPLFLPDRELVRKLSPAGFSDSRHLGLPGAEIYQAALAAWIEERFPNQFDRPLN